MAIRQYRTEYSGEFVITKTVFKNGKKEQDREWIENPIDVSSTSKRACCIVPHSSMHVPSLKQIEKHPGGLLGRDKMQLYAIHDAWLEMNPDFSVILTQAELDEVMNKNYQVDHIIYTSPTLVVANPGEFYLIPHGVSFQPSATVIWIACFDGHKDIYLFGYEQYDTNGVDQIKSINQISDIMQTYSSVNFHHVSNGGSPDAWRRCINCRTISTREFVSECDV